MTSPDTKPTPVITRETTPDTDSWISRNMKKRFSIVMLLALAGWTLLGFVPQFEAVLVNGMLLDTHVQFTFLTLINMIAVVFCISSIRLINSRIPGGHVMQLFGDGTKRWGKKLYVATTAIALITPIVLSIWFAFDFPETTEAHAQSSLLSMVVGVVAAWLFLMGIGFVKCSLWGSTANKANYFPFETRDRDGTMNKIALIAGIGSFLKRVGGWMGLENADYQFLAYLSIMATVHLSTAFWFSKSDVWWTSAPTMAIILIWVVGLLFAGVANLFDRYRLPVVLIMLVLITIWQIPFGSTSDIRTFEDKSKNGFVVRIAALAAAESIYLDTPPAQRTMSRVELVDSETSSLQDDAWNAIVKRMALVNSDSEKGKTLVVVTCPGGGIHAAAWSACVLDQLCKEYVQFSDSVCVISGVSGGSVGTLFFVSNQYKHQLLGLPDRPTIAATSTTQDIHGFLKKRSPSLDLAARSSLEQIAYGITTDDLYGALLPFLPVRGRGQRLEDGLMNRLDEPLQELTMGDWGDRALDGNVPIVIFNSTDAISGRRVLFDTIPTPRRNSSVGLKSRPLNYRELLLVEGNHDKETAMDVKPATAARTSATFPYVSPFTKPAAASPRGEVVAICDGGYADNEGIVTAVSWIDFLLKRWTPLQPDARPFDRILLLRIEPAANDDRNDIPDSGGLAGWLRWLTGPAETMASVRSASQAERGNLESDLAALYLEMATQGEEASSPTRTQTLRRFDAGDLSRQQGNVMETVSEATAYEQRQWSQEEKRQKWDGLIKEMQEKIKSQPGESPFKNALSVPGVFRPTPDTNHDHALPEQSTEVPVIVQTIRFENSGQVIPLNWKLSKSQKLWYLLAWEMCGAQDTKLRAELRKHFTETNASTE